MEFTKEDHEAVSAAIGKAEKRTCGQIVKLIHHRRGRQLHLLA